MDMCLHMDVSKNSGTPKSSILIGFSTINHPFWGTPIFWKHPYIPTYGHSSQRSSFPFDTYREYLHILEIVRLTLIIITTAIDRAFGVLYFQLKSHSMIFEQAWFHFMLVACSKHQVHEYGSNGLKPPTSSTLFSGLLLVLISAIPIYFIRWPVLH